MEQTGTNDAVLELYRLGVRNMLSGDKPGAIPNASYQHASIIVDELARCAKSTFRAFCEKMSGDVWTSQVLNQLQAATGRGVDVRIVLVSQPEFELPLFLKDRVRFLKSEELDRNRDAYNSLGHFAVVDGKSLRLEQDKDARKALFAANHPEIAGELDKIFDLLYEKAA